MDTSNTTRQLQRGAVGGKRGDDAQRDLATAFQLVEKRAFGGGPQLPPEMREESVINSQGVLS